MLEQQFRRLSADTVVAYWTADSGGDEVASSFGGLLDAKPEEVGEMYRSIWRGRPPLIDNPSEFYALVISSEAKGRAVVRGWIETTVSIVLNNLAYWFDDLAIVRNAPPPKDREHPPAFRMGTLMEAIADPTERRAEGVPGQLAAAFIRAALEGKRYPLVILQRALGRFRAELSLQDDEKKGWFAKTLNDHRAAILKAVLKRNYNEEVTVMLDPQNSTPAYVMGRLLAILEYAQLRAIGKNINATIIDRYLGGMIASPVTVLPRLLKLFEHHVSKLMDGPTKGTAIWAKNLVSELLASIDQIPQTLSLKEQAYLFLGYHHQRHFARQKVESNDESLETSGVQKN